jgi:hypothetical protein
LIECRHDVNKGFYGQIDTNEWRHYLALWVRWDGSRRLWCCEADWTVKLLQACGLFICETKEEIVIVRKLRIAIFRNWIDFFTRPFEALRTVFVKMQIITNYTLHYHVTFWLNPCFCKICVS